MIFRNPNYGNTFVQDTQVKVHDLLSGETQIFVPSGRPVVRGLSLELSALTDYDMQRLLVWIENSAGELVDIVDHEGNTWRGVIKSDKMKFVEGRLCQWSTGFEFEGSVI